MKSQWKSGAIAALICTVSLSAGCQSLPWLGNRKGEPAMTAQQYVEQTTANIQYDTSVDMDMDYQPSAATSFSPAPNPVPSRSLSGGGSCCH